MTNALGAARQTPALSISIAVLAVAVLAAAPRDAGARRKPRGGVCLDRPPEVRNDRTDRACRQGDAGQRPGDRRRPTRPPAVKQVIAAANKIRTKPYIYGGGHGRWWDPATTAPARSASPCTAAACSTPRCPPARSPAGASAGHGRWITVYANAGHAYAVIAGLRWDTAGNTSGTGPRWHKSLSGRSKRPLRGPPPGRLLSRRRRRRSRRGAARRPALNSSHREMRLERGVRALLATQPGS